MEANLADLFELAVDTFGSREYLVAEGQRRTYAEMEERANRLAHHLRAEGIGPGDHVGIYAYNSVEWVESLWAIFKLRAVWININYRYVEDELRYIVANADMVGLIHAAEFGDRVRDIANVLDTVRVRLVIDDGSGVQSPGGVDYERAIGGQSGERDFGPRSGDDHYILYTGGTTGLPKGVVWRHEDVFYALGGGINPVTNERVADAGDLVRKAKDANFPIVFLPIAPLMHGATQWGVMGQSFSGNKVILVAKFDAHRVWKLIQDEKVNVIMITGDAMGRPLIEALEQRAAEGDPYDTSSLLALSSTAATFSPSVKDQFLAHLPSLVLSDAIGSSETGANGHIQVVAGKTAMKGGPTVNAVTDTVVLDEDLREIPPGSGKIGRVARRGNIPVGYYNDPAKTAETFVEANGTRYAIPGDFAMLEADGTITLLGRGSVSINSGGEKIHPEEVEAAVKSHPQVWDATIVGIPDERWGQTVAAVVQCRPGESVTLAALQDHCRSRIAGYKVPRRLFVVPELVRSPSGKPDYRWAQAVATAGVDA
ncbi:MAG: acyl-CoA synthetase [Acidimicrobiales bacterium]